MSSLALMYKTCLRVDRVRLGVGLFGAAGGALVGVLADGRLEGTLRKCDVGGLGKVSLWEGSEGGDDNRGARTRCWVAKAGAAAVKTASWIKDGF